MMAGPLLGMPLEGVWHTAIVCHGVEWFYGIILIRNNALLSQVGGFRKEIREEVS